MCDQWNLFHVIAKTPVSAVLTLPIGLEGKERQGCEWKAPLFRFSVEDDMNRWNRTISMGLGQHPWLSKVWMPDVEVFYSLFYAIWIPPPPSWAFTFSGINLTVVTAVPTKEGDVHPVTDKRHHQCTHWLADWQQSCSFLKVLFSWDHL